MTLTADRPAKVRQTIDEADLPYTVLSDAKLEAASAFGIAYKLDDAMFDRLVDFGIDIEDASGETHRALPVPAVFVITDRLIRFQHVDPNYKMRLHPDVLMAAARAAGQVETR